MKYNFYKEQTLKRKKNYTWQMPWEANPSVTQKWAINQLATKPFLGQTLWHDRTFKERILEGDTLYSVSDKTNKVKKS